MRHLRKLLLLASLISFSPNLKADILRVPIDYPDIVAALAAVSGCDTIMIGPGTYSGPGFREVPLDSQCVTIMSFPDSGGVTIELAAGQFLLIPELSHLNEVRGVTFRNGSPAFHVPNLCTPRIVCCVFDSCQYGVWMTDFSMGTVDSCTFINCGAGATAEAESLGMIIKNRFLHNDVAIYISGWVSGLLVADNLIAFSRVAALGFEYSHWASTFDFVRNVLYRNFFGLYAGGEAFYDSSSFSCNLLSENTVNFYGGISDQIGLNGNFEANPRFCDTSLVSTVTVALTSPALAANNQCHFALGNLSVGCDCCFGTTGNIDYDDSDLADISDLSYFVDYLFFSGSAPVCLIEADLNPDSVLDISDLSLCVDFLFFGGQLPVCP